MDYEELFFEACNYNKKICSLLVLAMQDKSLRYVLWKSGREIENLRNRTQQRAERISYLYTSPSELQQLRVFQAKQTKRKAGGSHDDLVQNCRAVLVLIDNDYIKLYHFKLKECIQRIKIQSLGINSLKNLLPFYSRV